MTPAVILIDYREPEALRALGTVDPEIEARWGCDYAIVRDGTVVMAAQRKTPGDLLTSRSDGRLYRQIRLLAQAPRAVVLVEGHPRWAADGSWADWSGKGPRWTRAEWWASVDIILEAGLQMLEVADQAETAAWLRWQQCGPGPRTHAGVVPMAPQGSPVATA